MPARADRTADVHAITVTLEAEGRWILFVLLDDGGSINRQGSAREGAQDPRLCIGVTDTVLFRALRAHLTDFMLDHAGKQIELVEKRGLACRIVITFGRHDEERGLIVDYGADSGGVPEDIQEFVRQAETLTDPWYDEQRRFIRAFETSSKRSPWWRRILPSRGGGSLTPRE